MSRQTVWCLVERHGASRWAVGDEELHSRAYTIRYLSEDGRLLTLDVVRHASARATGWAQGTRTDDVVSLTGPGRVSETLQTEGDLVVAGDMTALPAMARILEALPAKTKRIWAAPPSQQAADVYIDEGRVTAIVPSLFDETIVQTLSNEAAP